MSDIVVSTFYKFVRLDDFVTLKKPLLKLMEQHQIRGTLLLAKEGINGTIAGNRPAIDALLAWLRSDPRFTGMETKESYEQAMPFYRSKVKLKQEIVTMGVDGINPEQIAGAYVKPEDWNVLISDPSVLLIDVRNNYEVKIGAFRGAVNPNTTSFREFPQYVQEQLETQQHKKVAMYCTGGIRCEKSTVYLREQGFEEVYHLQGGVLKYLETVPEKHSLWQGECFVFDNRVAVNHNLEKGQYDQCYACRYPITEAQKQSEHYIQGVSCPYCYQQVTDQQRQRFQEREKQVQLARQRGEEHIGAYHQGCFIKTATAKIPAQRKTKAKAKITTE